MKTSSDAAPPGKALNVYLRGSVYARLRALRDRMTRKDKPCTCGKVIERLLDNLETRTR